MLKNLLAENVKVIGVGEALVDAVIGFCVVFTGIALLVAIVYLVGKFMQSATKGGNAPKAVKTPQAAPAASVKREEADELSEETIAVITAAIAAYYEKEGRKCEFRVRRIKKY